MEGSLESFANISSHLLAYCWDWERGERKAGQERNLMEMNGDRMKWISKLKVSRWRCLDVQNAVIFHMLWIESKRKGVLPSVHITQSIKLSILGTAQASTKRGGGISGYVLGFLECMNCFMFYEALMYGREGRMYGRCEVIKYHVVIMHWNY